jgi:calcineurin-like phosphoesterase family protein
MSPVQLMTRRAWLRLTTCSLAGATFPVAIRPFRPLAASDFSFVVANDLHYRDSRCATWFADVVANIGSLQPRPSFVVLAGDLSEDGQAEQLTAIRDIFSALPMPVRSVIGNHDYNAEGERHVFTGMFGEELNQHFSFRGWQFLLLDTTEGRRVYRTHIPAATLDWLDRTVSHLQPRMPLAVITHFPLGRNWLRPTNARAVLDRLRPYDLQATLSGHWHGWTERVEQGVPLTTGRCCSWWRTNHDGSPAKGYFLCHASSRGMTHEFIRVA